MSTTNRVTVIVLAAGGGTRMKSKTMKVLHPLAGRSMIGHVLAAVAAVDPHRVVAVVGNQREQVAPHIQALLPFGAALRDDRRQLLLEIVHHRHAGGEQGEQAGAHREHARLAVCRRRCEDVEQVLQLWVAAVDLRVCVRGARRSTLRMPPP